MARETLKRVNFYDGQEISEEDLDLEQTAWHDSIANAVDFQSGSGVEQEFASQRVLFDTSDVPTSISDLLTNNVFDGVPIYETDELGLTTFTQPSDSVKGTQLEVELSGASLPGIFNAKVYVFGTSLAGTLTHEVLTFETNEVQVTRTYFTEMIAIMTQDFRGNSNTSIDGTASRDAGGRLKISEVVPMKLVRDPIMVSQEIEPTMEYVNFKPADQSKTLNNLLTEIAAVNSLSVDDLRINVTATTTRLLPKATPGLIVGQKFKATTNNIQKVSLLLSVQQDTTALAGNQYDFSGDIVVGIRKLQTSTQCPTDTIPDTSIEFDPELSPLAEVSIDQDGLNNIGITLNGTPKIVDFVFNQSNIGNPAVSPVITAGEYYMITISRSGNVSTGNIILQEAANTNALPTETDEMRMSVFSQNVWTDVPDSDMWFRVYTSALRVTSGTAFDEGVQIVSPKTITNTSTAEDESYIEGNLSLLDVSSSTENYVIVQKSNEFSVPVPHPTTGNSVYSRVEDAPSFSVVSESSLSSLISAGNDTIVLGYANDTNTSGNPIITGSIDHPGLVRSTTFTVIAPSSDITTNNLVGSILTPNTSKSNLKYRIIDVDVYTDAYGDVNGDGSINSTDVARAQVLDGYSKSLEGGSVLSASQLSAISNGTVTMEEILRADVTGNDVINILDAQAIQQYISLGTAFTAGSSFTRAVITVEDLESPKTTTVDMLDADSSFNDVPFSPVSFSIEFVPAWIPENLLVTDLRRFVPKSFTEITSTNITGTTKSGGSNTSLIPGNVLLGGNLLDLDSDPYSIDLEVNTIIVELPEGDTAGEIDIFTNYIKNTMKFGDGTYVTTLANNQVKVSANVQSLVKDIDGYLIDDGYSQAEEAIGVLYTQSSGILRIRAKNIVHVSTRSELRTKIILTVYLKKAGFQNTETIVNESTVTNLLTPI